MNPPASEQQFDVVVRCRVQTADYENAVASLLDALANVTTGAQIVSSDLLPPRNW